MINGSIGEDTAFIGVYIIMMVGYCGVGAFVAARASSNAVGWLMMTFGLSFLLGALSDEWANYSLDHGGAPLDQVAFWLTSWIYIVGLVALPLMLLLLPDGQVLTRRWRWVVRLGIVAGCLSALLSMVAPGPIELDVPSPPNNPLGIEALEPITSGPIGFISFLAIFLVALLAVVSLVLRYRRSDGADRQRLRLFTSVVLLATLLVVASVATSSNEGSDALNDILFISFFATVGIGIPAAMGVAILRFRMYDVELVIRKTVRFAVVTVLLAAAMGAILFLLSGPVVGYLAGDAENLEVPFYLSGIATGLLVLPLWRVSRRIADRVVFGGRSTPYEVMTAFSRRLGDPYETDDILPRMAAVLGNAVGAERADIWLGGPSERSHAAGWPDRSAPLDPGDDAVPVRYQGDELGALSVSMPPTDPMDASKRQLIADLAAQAGPVLRNVRLVEDLRESRRRIVTAQDERARKLERDIHDGAQQQLVALAVKLRLADQLVERDPTKAHEAIRSLQDDATQVLDDLRDLARGIYPPLLADQGLVAAVEAQARRAVTPTEIRADDIGRLGRDVEVSVYFCVLEALNNVAKYAGAEHVTITLARADGRATFSITDDGGGFDVTRAGTGTGVQGMRDRLDAVGGELLVESEPGRGTVIRGTVPVTAAP
jgi:signal transduction histidine kinase